MKIRPESGSTFDGFIREFDGVQIDNFTNCSRNIQLYLLSHSHADHLRGLDVKNFSSGCSIICSQLTLDILKKTSSIPKQNFQFFKAVEENSPFDMEINGEKVRTTLIPSYHCPGSVMFLLESSKSVLYTGDIRAEHWWVQSLGTNPFLLPYLSGLKELDNIYLDTTFGYRGEPFIEMLSNNQGITFLSDIMKYYPISDPGVKFCLTETTTGFEELWYKLVAMFDLDLSMDTHLEKRLRLMANANVPYCNYLCSRLNDEINSKLIVIGNNQKVVDCCKFPVSIRSFINCSLLDLKTSCFPLKETDVDWTKITHISTTRSEYEIVEYQEHLWLKYNGYLLPQNLKIPFSRHSSYSECIDFVASLNTRQVYGCVDSRLSWEQGFQMSRVFGEYCNGSSFIFDEERESVYGKVSKDFQVHVVNKWNETYNLRKLQETVRLPSFDFKGQHHVSGFNKELKGDNLKFVQQSKRLANANRYYIGRNIQVCEELISKNRFKIKENRIWDYNNQNKMLKNVDLYDSFTDISEESVPKRRQICINENDYRSRLILSDFEEESMLSTRMLKSNVENRIEECFTPEARFLKETYCGSNRFPNLGPFAQDIRSKAEFAATDDHGLGWFEIHLAYKLG